MGAYALCAAIGLTAAAAAVLLAFLYEVYLTTRCQTAAVRALAA